MSGDVDPRCERASTEGRNASHCITCGDIAVPMTVLRVDDGFACCEASGEQETVETALVGDVTPGDEVLVHAGVALVRL